MRIIGVIDLKDGVAVHAKGGDRGSYAPVVESAGSRIDGDPLALARTYLRKIGLTEIYIADLDAIQIAAPQDGIVRRIGELGARLLVDGGVTTAEQARRVASYGAQTVIVGLETLPSFTPLGDICAAKDETSIAFSLDLRNGVPVSSDPAVAASSPEDAASHAHAAGVDAVIVLDLARVGRGEGPAFDVMRRIRMAVPGISLLAGGGVRHVDDLRRLAELGCDGALVATALHEGRLTAADVSAATSPPQT